MLGINHLKRAFVSISVTPRKGDSAPATAWQQTFRGGALTPMSWGRSEEESLRFLSLMCCVNFPGGSLHFSGALDFSNITDQGLVKKYASLCVTGMNVTHRKKKNF